jgi:hypothetical protein
MGRGMDLEEILSSACRRKIIKYLADNGVTNIMRLILGIRGKYPQTNAELKILQKEGIVSDRHIGRTREIRLSRENANTGLILEALKILHSRDDKAKNLDKNQR